MHNKKVIIFRARLSLRRVPQKVQTQGLLAETPALGMPSRKEVRMRHVPQEVQAEAPPQEPHESESRVFHTSL